jgi:hypothetical protein
VASAPFYFEVPTAHPPDVLLRDLATRLTSIFGEVKFNLTANSPQALTYTRTFIPGWAVLVAIFLFPIGLLALTAKRQQHINITAVAHGHGSLITIAGNAPSEVEKALSSIVIALRQSSPEPGVAAPPPPPPPPPPPERGARVF